jgi:hypothetical protein
MIVKLGSTAHKKQERLQLGLTLQDQKMARLE